MSLSLCVRKWVFCAFAASIPALVFSAPSFQASSGESAIAGPQVGSQDYPHLSVGPYGGYLVWQDNTAPQGLTINAMPLNSGLSKAPGAFRVNQSKSGDHESARVALLKDGGAVFVWQGGRLGFQHIYARFLSASNTWLTGDVFVGSFKKNQQAHPEVAVLSNGNVVITWASRNQSSPVSMQDVYAQVFSPTGQKINSEFLVNQFTVYNQRTPTIAALANGGFVVAWVSEQQRSGGVDQGFLVYNANTNGDNGIQYAPVLRPSVDVFARAFDGNAAAVSDEFVVNSGPDICANPSIAAGADGGFLVAWSQKDPENRHNSWDVFARVFSASRTGGAIQRMNYYLYGDQYAPQASAVESAYLVIWTSMKQDGSWEGVYGQFLQPDGTMSGTEFRVNSTTVSRQFHPALAADASGRFIAVWSSFVGGGKDFDLYSQTYASSDYAPVLSDNRYGAPPADSGSSGGDSGSSGGGTGDTGDSPNKLGLPGNSTGGVATGGLPPAKATYNGLLYDSAGIAAASSGSFGAKVTDAKGTFSASLNIAGVKRSFTGHLDASGAFSGTVPKTTLHVQLQVDVANDQISGSVSDGHWTAQVLADRAVFNKTTHPAPQAGTYTLVIPGDSQDASCPAGAGFGTVKIGLDGIVQFTATLADGTKVTQGSALSKNGVWPLYIPAASGRGELISWIQFASAATSDLGGQMVWVKPATATRYYPRGFTNTIAAAGSAYHAPTPGTRALNINSGQLVLSGGNLAASLTNAMTLNLNNKATSTSGASLAIAPVSGAFKGMFVNPQTGKSMTFQGIVYKKANIGVGYFLGTDQSGEVFLSPAP